MERTANKSAAGFWYCHIKGNYRRCYQQPAAGSRLFTCNQQHALLFTQEGKVLVRIHHQHCTQLFVAIGIEGKFMGNF